MGQRPGRKGIGGETLVDEAEGGFDGGIHQVGEERLQLLREEHAFVDQGLRREAGDVKSLSLRKLRTEDGVLDSLANDVEHSLERAPIDAGGPAADQDLGKARFGCFGRWTNAGIVGRHLSPSEKPLSFFLHHPGKDGATLHCLGRVGREEHQPGAVAPGLGQFDALS